MINGNISCDQPNIFEFLVELTILLITQCFDGCGIDYSLFSLQRQCYGIPERIDTKVGKKGGYQHDQQENNTYSAVTVLPADVWADTRTD